MFFIRCTCSFIHILHLSSSLTTTFVCVHFLKAYENLIFSGSWSFSPSFRNPFCREKSDPWFLPVSALSKTKKPDPAFRIQPKLNRLLHKIFSASSPDTTCRANNQPIFVPSCESALNAPINVWKSQNTEFPVCESGELTG